MKHTIKKIMTSSRKARKSSPLQAVAAEEVRRRRALTDAEMKRRMERIDEDFRHAFALIKQHPDTVSFFGSSAISSDSKYYSQARTLAHKIVDELGLTIVSGGGPGIMEAANRGAQDAEGDSVGATIEVPHEQVNQYITHSDDFYYFFSRKVALTFTARAYMFFPGGFGTLDELFEILTLKKTDKIPQLPVILVGADFWKPLTDFIENTLCDLGTIAEIDTQRYVQEDDPDKIIDIIINGGRPAPDETQVPEPSHA